MDFLNALIKNWKLVLVIFSLGGTITVLSVVPGTDAVKSAVQTQLDATTAKLVSATTVSATAE